MRQCSFLIPFVSPVLPRTIFWLFGPPQTDLAKVASLQYVLLELDNQPRTDQNKILLPANTVI